MPVEECKGEIECVMEVEMAQWQLIMPNGAVTVDHAIGRGCSDSGPKIDRVKSIISIYYSHIVFASLPKARRENLGIPPPLSQAPSTSD